MSEKTEQTERKLDRSEQRLRELGYKQELRRELTSFTNFSVSFSIVSILTGLTSLYTTALNAGGPVVIIWGWVFVSFMSLCVALSMAEICSSYPTSGGLYYYSSKLAGKHGPLMAWITGWMNLLGQFSVTAGIDFGLALLIAAVISLGNGWVYEKWHVVLIYLAILLSHVLLNIYAVKLIPALNTTSVWVHLVGVVIILVTLFAKTEKRATAAFVFTQFENNTGFSSVVYVVLLGLLQSQFTMTGYDASAHMAEETRNADVAGPIGIVMAVVVSFGAGFLYLVALTFGIQDLDTVLNSSTGNAVVQIFLDSVGETGAILLLCIIIAAQYFCGNASVCANSRMLYSFSRDGALPGSKYFHRVHPTLKSPVYGVILSGTVSGILGLLYLASTYAFNSITSLATIALYISYGLPTLCRITFSKDTFEKGPIHLGRFSTVIGWTSVIWIMFITVLFVLPGAYPVTETNMNYTIVIFMASLIFIFGYWVISARHWFKGPVPNVDMEDQFPAETTVQGSKMEVQSTEIQATAVAGDKMEVDTNGEL